MSSNIISNEEQRELEAEARNRIGQFDTFEEARSFLPGNWGTWGFYHELLNQWEETREHPLGPIIAIADEPSRSG